MKKNIILIVAFLLGLSAGAQESLSSYTVLKFPLSVHSAALGGENISIVEDAPAAGLHNPALFSSVSDNSIGLSFMNYVDGGKWMGGEYVRAFGERHTGAAFAQYMGYGSMDETDEVGNVIGSFSPKDIIVGAGYSYLLSDRWAGGANAKMVFSSLGTYHSVALAFDLGINYYDEESDLSLSAVMRNVGAQLKSYDGTTERVPYNLQLGLTKGIAHAPLRISVTLSDLTRWKDTDFYVEDGEKIKFTSKLMRHVVVGLDILPTDYIYLSAGYNFRRAAELKAAGSSHLAGLTFGGGLALNRFKFGVSYAKYHQACSSLMVNAAFSL